MLPKREFLQLAKEYKPDMSIGGWLFSEKLDGIRIFWDGGATRGIPVRDVPFANILKQDRFIHEHVATGLWSRYGHPIFAPDWWINRLPNFMLDGECWLGRQLHQQTSSIVRTLPAERVDDNWIDMRFKVFDTPPISSIMEVGEINNTNFVKIITPDIGGWFLDKCTKAGCRMVSKRQFASQLIFLEKFLQQNETVHLHEQVTLPQNEVQAKAKLRTEFERLVSLGAEGAIVRAPHSEWRPIRTPNMIKVKQVNDAEATVVGYLSAEFGETGAKLGLIGSLMCTYMGKPFKLAGLTDEERAFGNEESVRWAKRCPGEEAPAHVISKHFPRGSTVTFKYSEFTVDGIPKEARYNRKFHGTH